MTVSSLTNGNTYTCTAVATNAIGDGAASAASSDFVAVGLADGADDHVGRPRPQRRDRRLHPERRRRRHRHRLHRDLRLERRWHDPVDHRSNVADHGQLVSTNGNTYTCT